jgi:hypothetical protein
MLGFKDGIILILTLFIINVLLYLKKNLESSDIICHGIFDISESTRLKNLTNQMKLVETRKGELYQIYGMILNMSNMLLEKNKHVFESLPSKTMQELKEILKEADEAIKTVKASATARAASEELARLVSEKKKEIEAKSEAEEVVKRLQDLKNALKWHRQNS